MSSTSFEDDFFSPSETGREDTDPQLFPCVEFHLNLQISINFVRKRAKTHINWTLVHGMTNAKRQEVSSRHKVCQIAKEHLKIILRQSQAKQHGITCISVKINNWIHRGCRRAGHVFTQSAHTSLNFTTYANKYQLLVDTQPNYLLHL